jgi:hypothetical protein
LYRYGVVAKFDAAVAAGAQQQQLAAGIGGLGGGLFSFRPAETPPPLMTSTSARSIPAVPFGSPVPVPVPNTAPVPVTISAFVPFPVPKTAPAPVPVPVPVPTTAHVPVSHPVPVPVVPVPALAPVRIAAAEEAQCALGLVTLERGTSLSAGLCKFAIRESS